MKSHRRVKLPLVPLLLISGYLLLIVAWAISNPPAAAPDEYAHYLRAYGVSRGEFAPDKRQGPLVGADRSKIYLQWQRLQSRMIKVPGRYSPEAISCKAPRPSWGCPQPPPPANETFELRSWVGTYPPYAYVLPGLAMRLGSETVSALLWGRLASGITSATLLALAALILWDRQKPWICLLGLIAAVTPMVIFTGSSLTASGPEIAAGICFIAALMRLSRRDQEPTPSVWLVTALGGAMLVLSRDLGILWIAIGGLLFVGLSGWKSGWETLRRGGKPGLTAAVTVGLAAVAAMVWQLKIQVRPTLDWEQLLSDLKFVHPITKEILRQEIGVFGSLDTVMPDWAYLAWGALVLSLIGLATFLGTWRQKSVLGLAVFFSLSLPFVIDAVQRQVAFGAQGRHVLPITVAVPLVAGEILNRNSHRLRRIKSSRPTFCFAAVAGFIYLVAWYVNGKRHVVGPDGSFFFWEGLASHPPRGWATWAGVTAVAALAIIGFGFLASFGSGRGSDVSGAPTDGFENGDTGVPLSGR